VGGFPLDFAENVLPRLARQAQIKNNNAGRRGVHRFHGDGAVASRHYVEPRRLKSPAQGPLYCEIVFNDQNSFHNRTPDGGLKLASSHSSDFRDLLE
jgi:hypothetical protein